MKALSFAVLFLWLVTIVLSFVAADEGCTRGVVDVIGSLLIGPAIGLSVLLAAGYLLEDRR